MIDTFTINHYSGPCSNPRFGSNHFLWDRRKRVLITSAERITITLYGHGADLAQNVTGSNLHEWILERGTTTDYPDAPIMFGSFVAKGYVKIAVRATRSHGLGNRRITIRWVTGNEVLHIKIVGSCSEATASDYRVPSSTGGYPSPTPSSPWPISTGPSAPTHGSGNGSHPNLLPSVSTPYVLTRPLTGQQIISTPSGGMVRVHDFFGSGLADNLVTEVPVPNLKWGIIGTNIESANTQFDAQLIDLSDANNPRVLDTLILPQGFPPNTPLVTKDNYPGRPTTIRVIKNPTFQIGTGSQSFIGTFTEPGSWQLLDPLALLLVVDSDNRIDEGNKEID